jgi:MFS family permease
MTAEQEMGAAASPEVTLDGKWRVLLLLALAELLAMAVWFSANAVVTPLTDEWELTAGGVAWLTMSVQIGFVLGAFGSALLTLPDRIPPVRLFVVSSFAAAASTALLCVLANGIGVAIVLRMLTGMFLAGVYPVGMKLVASWTQADRGLGIGMLVGALAVGSGAPHLLNAFGGVGAWRPVVYAAAALAATGGLIGLLFIREGPYRAPSPPFRWGDIGRVLRNRDVMLANGGYLGHMWELYAMWAWFPVFAAASFAQTGTDPRWASALAFAVIGAGGLGSLLAGKLADQLGRTTVTITSLVISGACALVAGTAFGAAPAVIAGLGLVWGFAVVADSAQFSASVTELADRSLIGTALTLQTSMGFLLTLFSIRLLPAVEGAFGWGAAFAFLTVGPLLGIWSMWTLRQSDAAGRLAGGNR